MFSKLRLRKGIAYLLIWLQLLTPGLSLLPMVARASEPADMQSTVQGLNALILGAEAPATSAPKAPTPSVTPSQASTPAAPASSSRLSDYFHVQDQATTPAPEAGLPSLTSPKSSADKTDSDKSTISLAHSDEAERRVASGAMQMGSLLSQDNTSDAAINYARSIGEGLINQQVNDWLNQYGNAKVSLGTHQNLSGDILVPVYETDQNLVFSQVGARTNQDRNTVNLGFGYRQYLNDWMLGINTFYDYDYTGKNKRIGVGTEAWTDYLKLAANGYIRQTNWHQSKLDDMEDYDERPANGFDLRANAYLPSWPNWGGSLKYEQYFGKGVSVAESASPDSLKDNPVVVTAGVDYTPFPLMTLSAKRSIGDSNETNVGLDFTYRFGVPWEQQIDPGSVGLMRSLVGSKYDFVDRNYNIVMQYRKQELLTISLPAATTAQAAETVPVILTVSKAKYGLKSVSWNVDATLTARGGRYQQVSPTELRVTLPAYVFGQRTNAAQNYKISAVATDNNGNQSNTAEMLIGVVPSENTVSHLTVSPSDKNLPANDTESYTITGTVTDGKGAPLANQKVTFAVEGLINAAGQAGTTLAPIGGGKGDSRQLTVTTGIDGKATIILRSKVAGEGGITATMDNGNSSTAKVTFVADTTTAAVTALVAEDDNAIADGKATNSVLITVKDKFGNPINGADVYLTASNEAKIVNKVSTNEQGSAKVTLTSTKAGPSTIAASLNDSQKEVTVTFGVGKPDQDKSGISTNTSDYVAGDDIAVSVVLKDGQNNSITGKSALLTDSAVKVESAAAKSGSKWVEETQSPGTYTRHYVAKTASDNQHATLNLTGWSKTSDAYNITANMNTAAVVSLEVKDNNAVADGTAKNSVIVTVEDNYQNRVTGAVVSLTASNGALIAESETTGPAGTVLVTLTNAKAGVSTVSASLNSSSKSVNVSFGVGEPVKANSSITTNKTSYISGSEIQVEVTLADQKQNAVAGLNSTKLNSMVKVDNAEAKSTTNWVESATKGTYVGTYVAKASGEKLTATLKISDGNIASEMYAITAGEAVLANSSITRDSASYVSGDDIKVTVTLKDGNTPTANPVTGLSSDTLSGMVTVANADAKSKANWVESSTKGTYEGTFVARAAGTGLKATLKIGSGTKDSATYAITAGDAVLTNSTITRDSDSYVSGTDMKVTVTLKDGNTTPNPVTGLSSDTLSGMVTVANADAKSKANWVESSTKGTYVGTYVAKTAGTGLKATLKVSDGSKTSDDYVITAGDVVLANSTIARDSDSYVSGTDIKVTVVLKDGNTPTPNPVTGLSSDKLTAMVAVANADAKSNTNWVESATKGTYVGTYVARAAGTGLKATLTIGAEAKTSENYVITAGDAVLANSSITRDSDSYVSGSDMKVTVTLKDGNTTPNPVTGLSSDTLSGMVTVANADAKSKANWVESATKGTYEGTFVARAAGTGLKATLTIGSGTKDSATYAITAGDAVLANSSITRDSDSYVSGTDIKVTVVLKDGNTPTPNPVTGLSSDKLAAMVAVANADAKSNTNWVESSTKGTYEGIYVAKKAGTGLKATLTISNNTLDADLYNIVADAATAQVDTVILEDSDVSKVADSKNTFTYTVTVKDSNGNLVSGVTVAPKVDKAGATATVSGVTGVTGETKITLTGSMTVVSDITVSAQVGTTASKNADKTVSFTYGEVATISLATTDGKTTAVVSTQPAQTLTLTVEDEYGRKIPNQTINLAISGGSGGKPSIYPSSVTSDAVSGEIADKALLADTTAETVTVTASLSGSNVKGTLLINFVPDVISTNTSTITADPARIVADGQSTSKVVYVPKDRYGNVITDITPSTISSTIIGMSNTEFTLSGWTYANKQYTAVVTAGTTTGGFRVIPVIDGNDGVSRSGGNILTLVAGDIDITQSSIKAVPATIIADGKSTSTLQFVPKDKFGNIIDSLNASSISQVLTGDATDMKVGAWTYSSNSQWYTAMLTAGTMSGAANIMPTVNGENAAQNGVTNTLTLAYSSSVKDIVATSVGTAIADGAQTNQVTVTIYGANNQIISGATVNITPSSKELLINGQNAVYTGTTDAKGQVTVSMASTFIGENQFTVESDRYSEVSDTSFGIYVSPVLSSVGFDKTDLFNNGTDKMTVTFYPVDAKGRAVEGLDVEFTSTDAGATLTSSGYATVVTTKGNPTTYFLSVVIKNYSLWKPDDSQYNVIPESGVKLATISVQPKLCALDTPNLPGNAKFTHCSPSDSVNYYHSGLGFVVKKIDANPQWKDQKLTLQSSTIDGELLLTSPTGNSQNCSVPVSDSASWMNDFGDKDNIFPMDFNNVSIIDTYQTPGFVGPAFSGGGVGSCEVGTWNNPDKLNVNLSGRGNVLFTIRTSNPDSITPLKVPLTSSRVDAGLIGSPISVNIYSVN